MKICPACNRTYADDSLSFCLDDGSVLSTVHDPEKTHVLHGAGPEAKSVVTQVSNRHGQQETVRFPAPTVQSAGPTLPAAFAPNSPHRSEQRSKGGSARILLGVLGGLVLGVAAAGIVGGLIWFNRDDNSPKRVNANLSSEIAKTTPINPKAPDRSEATPTPPVSETPAPTATNTPKIEKTPTPDVPEFGPMSSNISLNGTNLTYYQGSTPQRCQADCAANPKCKGFTYIRPGGYNQGDPAMCYLASSVSGRVTHTCCISGVKR